MAYINSSLEAGTAIMRLLSIRVSVLKAWIRSVMQAIHEGWAGDDTEEGPKE